MDNWRGRLEAREQELAAEIQSHLELEAEDQRDRGLSPEAARLAARRNFGNLGVVREQVRDAWGWGMFEQFVQDVRYAFRTLRGSPGFAATAILSLALGIGVNSGVFALADALVFRPLAIDHPGSLVVIRSTSPEIPSSGISYPDFKDFRDKSSSFAGLVAHRLSILPMATTPEAVPQMRMGMRVSRDFFQVLGVQPVLGRGFLPGEVDVNGRDAVAVLSYGFWQSEFGGRQDIVGQPIYINQQPVTIVGIAPRSFTGMDPIIQPFLYVPATLGTPAGMTAPGAVERRDELSFIVRGRLHEGVTTTAAQTELAGIARVLEEQFPATNRRRSAVLRTELQLRSEQAPALLPSVLLLSGLAGLVLVIVCANVANLFLARARARSREIAIRLAIGAGQFRLVRQLLTECLVIALLGATGGLALAVGLVRYLGSIRIPTDTPMVVATQVDARLLLFSVLTALFSAIAFGLAPARQAGRTDLVTALKRADASSLRRSRMFGRQALVVGQIAVALVLLIAAGLMVEAFRRMLVLDTGFRTERVLMMELDPGSIGYSEQQTHDFYLRLVDRVGALPGIVSASLSRAIPFRPSFADETLAPEGFELPPGQDGVSVATNTIGTAYFETMRTEILRGRSFNAEDRAGTRAVAIVNDTFARMYWPGSEAVGKRFRFTRTNTWMEVVGVARTAKYFNITEPPQPYVYLPLEQHPTSRLTLLVHTAGDPVAAAAPLREAVRALDARLPVANTRSLQAVYEDGALGLQRVILQLVTAMGALGLTLALVGTYGVIAYAVRRRTREFGVRMSIGANRGDILRMVLREGLVLAAGGLVLGLALGSRCSARWSPRSAESVP